MLYHVCEFMPVVSHLRYINYAYGNYYKLFCFYSLILNPSKGDVHDITSETPQRTRLIILERNWGHDSSALAQSERVKTTNGFVSMRHAFTIKQPKCARGISRTVYQIDRESFVQCVLASKEESCVRSTLVMSICVAGLNY